ncbi:Uncharacterized protein M6_Spy0233 [Durusdinium trenchii]|uniref:Uncharacterized protein M6_Spy0233 n=1 Tax=Durusdinium trenchii TaxID=1381693 RepID=A0ABP0P5A5_9DINO
MAQFEVLRGACASALKIQLQSGAAVSAENDALVSKTQNVEIGASLGSGGLLGGLLGGAARSFLTNESFFLQTLRCRGGTGEVLVAPQEQGDIAVVRLGQDLPGILVTQGAFLCSEEGIEIETRMQGATQGFFGGSGFFLMRCRGRGCVGISCTGSCIKYELQAGEARVVDNGHLVAWGDAVSYTVGMASNSLFGTVASGEGLMCTFVGPGPVWIQTHKPTGSQGPQRAKKPKSAGPQDLMVCALFACVVFMIFAFLLMVFLGNFDDGPRKSRFQIDL